MTEKEQTEMVPAEKSNLAKAAPNYIQGILQALHADFVAANAGLDLDFVHMGTWLVTDKKGNFVEKDNEEVKYGDTLDVVIGMGEKRWSMWGEKNSPEDGMLIVAEKDQDEAVEKLTQFLDDNPDAQERYSLADLQLRYMAYVVPVDSISAEDFPKVYLMSFSPTATIAFGKWAMEVYKGKYKNQGIPARTGINKVITRLSTSEKTSKRNAGNSWIGLDFTAVDVFDPAVYGIKQ